MSNDPIERNLGTQPLAGLMEEHELDRHALVEASKVPMTHKLIARACKGRRLTRKSQFMVLNAFNAAAGTQHALSDLFNY